MRKKSLLRNEEGFTLIEIVAVLVIVGILSAVAVPKYINLTADAEGKAAQAVKAEIQARATQFFANEILTNNGTVTAVTTSTFTANCGGISADDFDGWTKNGDTDTELTKTSGGKKYTIKVGTSMAVDKAAIITLTSADVVVPE